MAEKEDSVRILFRFYSDLLEEETVETIWATNVDEEEGLYKIDSIPFYAEQIAPGDIVFAEFDEEEEMLTFREAVEYSGNSVIQVAITDDSQDIEVIRDLFRDLGCRSEKMHESFFVMEIPAAADYKIIKAKLEELENTEVIAYAELCLSENHSY